MVGVLAQMAELVDALVSNTNEVTLVPVRLRLWVQRLAVMQAFFCFLGFTLIHLQLGQLSFAVQLGELWTMAC